MNRHNSYNVGRNNNEKGRGNGSEANRFCE